MQSQKAIACVSLALAAGYCKFAYGDESQFPSGKTVSIRDQKIDHEENKVTETIDLDITVTWNSLAE